MSEIPKFDFDLVNRFPRPADLIRREVGLFFSGGGSPEELVRQLNAASRTRSGLFHVFGYPDAMPFIEAFSDYGALAIPAVLSAVKQGEMDLINFYLERNADPDEGNDWGLPLNEAARYVEPQRAYEMVKRLLEAGADPNITDYAMGYTPLMFAAGYGYNDVVQLLIDAGADVRRTCTQGETALHKVMRPVFSSGGGRHMDADPVAIARLLIERGADVNARSFARYTPLHALASHGTAHAGSLLQVLLDAGANLESRLRDGMTPLLVAAQANSPEAITALLDAGADSQATSKFGAVVSRLGGPETKRLVKSRLMAQRIDAAMGAGAGAPAPSGPAARPMTL